MNESVNRGLRRHRVFENLVPSRKNKIARDYNAAGLIAGRQKSEKYISLISGLRNVGNVID